ncbi:DUF1360 domain-containing protein [Brevibacillus sp. SYSU BS000544]|uniref:DUF1360 domain-containing protein n=1 Tax=Brevibacillus sp. SYSU BS000544 TaxID=3416443 RepID=UPI003CE58FE8
MQDIDWLTYLMLILASYRFTHLIVFDKITEFIRNPFLRKEKVVDSEGHVSTKKTPTSMFGYLLNCYWCTGIWSAIFLGAAYLLIPRFSMPLIFILSIAGAQAILETFVGVGVKLVQYIGKRTEKME